ncbi:RebB family R body protein [Archangium lipolyticum]|uniref:RebB family R body protein n=1 Tax=Archangium lipolyticum TaxID=2970465 RepID=UPI00214A2E36|nr:RebB family R body protein [Archangium lipolyticum]
MADSDNVDLATLGAEVELVRLGTAVAQVLAKLNEVTARQQQGILDLVVEARVACESVRGPAPESKSVSLPPIEPAQSTAPVEGDAPESSAPSVHPDEVRARALASVYEAAAQALGLAFHNAVANQQQLNALGQAALSQAAVLVLSSGSSGESHPVGVLKAG